MSNASLNQFHRDILVVLREDRDYLRCLLLREKLYRELKPKLYLFVSYVLRNNWHSAVSFDRFFPADGDQDKIDPAQLLKFICYSPRFYVFGHISRRAHKVKNIRNKFYGHIPELRITDTLISRLPITSSGVLTFDSIILEVDALTRLLANFF
jgi:hypothetical protein